MTATTHHTAAFDSREISLLVRSYYDVQKLRIEHELRVKGLVRAKEKTSEDKAERHYGIGVPELLAAEKAILRRVDSATSTHPLRTKWLRRVRGIGPVLASGILANIERRFQRMARMKDGSERWVSDPSLYPHEGAAKKARKELGIVEYLEQERHGIACFDNPAKLWTYCGLNVVDGRAVRREKGKKLQCSTIMKVLAWKLGETFVRCGRSYRQEYDRYKARFQAQHPEEVLVEGTKRKLYTKGHIHACSKRYVAKLFLAHTWQAWRELEGLPVVQPYALQYLQGQGHTTQKHWRDYADRKEEEIALEPEIEIEIPENDEYSGDEDEPVE